VPDRFFRSRVEGGEGNRGTRNGWLDIVEPGFGQAVIPRVASAIIELPGRERGRASIAPPAIARARSGVRQCLSPFFFPSSPPFPSFCNSSPLPPSPCSAACAHVACESPGQSAVFIPTLLCERARVRGVRGVRECGRPIGRISARPMTSPESASSYERALLGNPEIARRQGRSSSRSAIAERDPKPRLRFSHLAFGSLALGALRCCAVVSRCGGGEMERNGEENAS